MAGWSVITMMTWSVHGFAFVHVAFCGSASLNVCVPVVNPSAMMGWVGDHTGLTSFVGEHTVGAPAGTAGSGSDASVCVELFPSTSATRYQPGC